MTGKSVSEVKFGKISVKWGRAYRFVVLGLSAGLGVEHRCDGHGDQGV